MNDKELFDQSYDELHKVINYLSGKGLNFDANLVTKYLEPVIHFQFCSTDLEDVDLEDVGIEYLCEMFRGILFADLKVCECLLGDVLK